MGRLNKNMGKGGRKKLTEKKGTVVKKEIKKSNGIYDPRNKLNNLTGKEWKFASKSVIIKLYPPGMQMQLRKQHGGQKPPELCADLIKIFSKEGQLVLDPLMGVGGTLLGASLCNRRAIGYEINPKWIEIYREICRLEDLKEQDAREGDCRPLLDNLHHTILENKLSFVDLVLTDVPYWNMDKLTKTRSKDAFRSNLNKFNGKTKQTKEEWLKEMSEIFKKCEKVLKEGGYMAIFIGDLYREKEYHMLSANLAKEVSGIDNLVLKANLIWYDVSKSLHIYGYPFSFIPSMIHQNILVFKKEIKK